MNYLLARVVFIAIIVLCMHPAWVSAQPTDGEIGEMGMFLNLFPELRSLPAPPWVGPGVRVTYQTAGAAWAGGAAGAGVVPYDVAARDGVQVFAYIQSYIDGGQGVIPAGNGVGRGLPGVGPFWINPAVLGGAEALSNENLAVTRYDKQVGDGPLGVVRFQTTTANGRTV